MQFPSVQTVEPIRSPFSVSLRLPSSKSITLRQLVISALARHTTTLVGFDRSDDVDAMIDCLQRLGVEFRIADGSCHVDPTRFNLQEDIELDLRMSGLTLRLLLAVATLRAGTTSFIGSDSLKARPNLDLLDSIDQLGCSVQSESGHLPITIRGPVQTHRVELKSDVSSQYLTALLLVAPSLPRGLEIALIGEQVSASYIEITRQEMIKRGVNARNADRGFVVEPAEYSASEVAIEGDASASTYFAALATLHRSEVEFQNLGAESCQGDVGFFDVCERLGAMVESDQETTRVEGPSTLRNLTSIDMIDMPDAALTLMAIAPYLESELTITGLATLPFKECDRIACPATELRRAGIVVKEGKDFVSIQPGIPQSSEFQTYDDHRMAMAFAVLATRTQGCKILDPSCVAKTYPKFWTDLDKLYKH